MKKYFVLMVIALIALAAGCKDKTDAGTTASTPGKSFVGGTEGLKLEFFPGAPPEEVYDKDYPFGINLRVENAGEYDILDPADATLTIIGINPADFGTTATALTKNVPEMLYGVSLDATGNKAAGAVTSVDFPSLQYARLVVGNPQFVIRANVCYEYGTTVISKLCILEDLLGRTRKRGETPFCDPNAQQQVENSGAPVQVNLFKQSVIGSDKVSFQFNIKHVGTGSISKLGSECSTNLAEKDVVYVKVDTGLEGLTCSGFSGGSATEGYATLYGGAGAQEKLIVCTQQLNAVRGDFDKPIRIDMTYDYEQYIDTNLIVRHVD